MQVVMPEEVRKHELHFVALLLLKGFPLLRLVVSTALQSQRDAREEAMVFVPFSL